MAPLVGPDYLRDFLGPGAPEPLTRDHLKRWLSEFLAEDEPRPADEELAELAAQINFIAERSGGADEPLQEESARRFMAMRAAAANYRAAYEEYTELAYLGVDPAWTQADEIFAGQVVPSRKQAPPSPPRGRPPERWHSFGRRIADMFSAAMQKAGCKGRLSKKQENSLTAALGAEVIRHLLRIEITPAGFATAMRRRNRRRK